MNRTFATLMMLGVLASSAGAQQPISAGYRATRDVALRIWVPTGLVRLIAWDRDSIAVSGTTGKRGKYFGGSGGAQAKLGIEPLDSSNPALPGGDLTVHVPRGARVWVKMTFGHVDSEGITGELEAYTVGGSVVVRNSAGVVSVETIDASVSVTRADGALRIRGGKGSVSLRDVSGTATVVTVSGDVTIAGPRVPDARVETIGGAINADGRLGATTQLDLQTHSGVVTVAVNPAALPALELATRGGKITNPFKPARGRGKVAVKSFKGDINVRAATDIEGGK